MIVLFIWMLVAHFAGDFLLQHTIGNMAVWKGKSLIWLTIHVFMYSLPLAMVTWLYEINPIWWMGNMLMHWVTDFVTSKYTALYWRKQNIPAFWITVGLDQLIHIATLFLTYGIITNTL